VSVPLEFRLNGCGWKMKGGGWVCGQKQGQLEAWHYSHGLRRMRTGSSASLSMESEGVMHASVHTSVA